MNDENLDTGKSKLEIAAAEFKRRVGYFPEIGHNFGIYEYTPSKVIYPLQTFDREKVAEALNTMSDKGKGPTPLANAVEEAEKVQANISRLNACSRLVLLWHGSDNPVASNDTDEGRAKNRRVEVAVGGV
jgi:hypothetical protein